MEMQGDPLFHYSSGIESFIEFLGFTCEAQEWRNQEESQVLPITLENKYQENCTARGKERNLMTSLSSELCNVKSRAEYSHTALHAT